MAGELQDLVALVTGGASGIGAATARELCRRGAHVAVMDQNLDGVPPDIFSVQGDVGDDLSVREATDKVFHKFGRLDIVVNNAGIGAQGDVTTNTDEEWLQVLNVNLMGVVRVSRAALPYLRQSPRATIVNTSSVAAVVGLPDRALYSASKGAVLALTRAMAADHLLEGIRVNCVNPGTVDTPWVNRLLEGADDPDAERAALSARQPHKRLVAPEEVASAIVYLAGPHSGSTTGVGLAVDGGMRALRLRPEAVDELP